MVASNPDSLTLARRARRVPRDRQKFARWLLPLAIAACWTIACGCDHQQPATRGVVLITLDTTRRDRLGCYGDALIATPAIDGLAGRGARFDTAVAAVPLTLPSHTTLMSGLLPPGHQVFENGHYRVGQRLPLLAESFKQQGFATGAFVGALVLAKEYGLDRGFTVYDDAIDVTADRLIAERRGDVVTDRALAWLQERLAHDEKFFLWLHLFDPHQPLEPPEPFRSRYASDPYRGEVAFCDAQVQRVLDALNAAQRTPSTLIIVAADHGEAQGDHDEDSHGLFVYDATTLVPLIIAGAGVAPGVVIAGVVSLADVAPTVLEWCGLARPGKTSGRSLASSLRSGEKPDPVPAYVETRYCALHFGWAALAGVRTETFKFIDAPHAELYDLIADPAERTNVFASKPEVVTALRQALAHIGGSAQQVDGGTEEIRMTDQMRARMTSLGYLASASHPSPVGGTRRDPKDMVVTYHRLNRLPGYEKAGRLAERIAEARLVLRADADNPSAFEHLGISLAVAGRFDEAIAPLERARVAGENSVEICYRLGVSYFQLGQDALALPELTRCTELDPNEPIPFRYLGLIADRAGQTDLAIKHYRKFLEMYHGDPVWSDPIKQRLQQLESGSR